MFEETMLNPPADSKKIFTHVVIVCDTFDHEDYPVFVAADEDVRAVCERYSTANMQRVMEVYDLTESEKPLAVQKRENRSRNFGLPSKINEWVEARRREQALKLLSTEELERELKERRAQAKKTKKVSAR